MDSSISFINNICATIIGENPSVWQRVFDKARITPPMLRYYFATYSLRNGAKAELIPKILEYRMKISYDLCTAQEAKP